MLQTESYKVPMDYRDGIGRIITDPDEARAAAAESGRSMNGRHGLGIAYMKSPWYYGDLGRNGANDILSQKDVKSG